MDNYINTLQASKKMGVSEKTVRDLCRRGFIRGAKQSWGGGPWKIPAASVDAWVNKNNFYKSTTMLMSKLNFIRILIVGILMFSFALISGIADMGTARQQLENWGLLKSCASARNNEILIVVHQFYRTEGVVDTDIHGRIRRTLTEKIQELQVADVRVCMENRQLLIDDLELAKKLGESKNASIVIWGADTGTDVTVNFLNLKALDTPMYSIEGGVEASQLVNPDAYAVFTTQDIQENLTFLSLYGIGIAYYINEDYTDAASIVEEGLSALSKTESTTGLFEAYNFLGWLYSTQLMNGEDGSYEKAIAAYSKAIEINPEDSNTYNNRSMAHFFNGNYDEASSDILKAIEYAKDSKYALDKLVLLGNLAAMYMMNEETDKWMNVYAMMIELDPEQKSGISYYIARGSNYYSMGEYEKVILEMNTGIKSVPSDPFLYTLRGKAYTKIGELKLANLDFDKAVSLDTTNPAVYCHRGLYYSNIGEIQLAEKDFQKAIQMSNDSDFCQTFKD